MTVREIDVEPAGKTAEEIDAQVAALEQERRDAAGREVWRMHSRKCRRNLQLRLKVKPEELEKHVALCQCGWPKERFRQYQEAQLAALAAAAQEEAPA